MGTGQSMWIGADDSESLRALERAIDLGVNFIDTALDYGSGHSEELVGRTVRGRSETVYVATKIPPKNSRWPASGDDRAEQTFPAEHVCSCTERSLHNLGLETIDVQQFHVWNDNWLEQGDWLEAVEAPSACRRSSTTSASRPTRSPRSRCAYILSGEAVSTVIPGHALGPQRRAQLRGGGRARTAARPGREAARPALGAQLLPLRPYCDAMRWHPPPEAFG